MSFHDPIASQLLMRKLSFHITIMTTCALPLTTIGQAISFPFDEPGGKITGEVSFAEEGKKGKCATFTGSGAVELTEIPFHSDSKCTIAFWVKGKEQLRKVIVGSTGDYWNADAKNGGFSIFSVGIEGMAMHTSRNDLGINNQVGSGGVILNEEWHHFAYVKDGQNVRIYIDGEQTSAKHLQPEMYRTNNKITLFAGGGSAGSPANFSGSIDELHIFDQALHAAAVRALAGGSGPDEIKKTVISQREMDYDKINAEAEKSVGQTLELPAKELRKRDGLRNFFAKAKAGKPVTIAYFGGSITAHPGWRPQSFKAIQEMFPESRMTMINASIGGTGSVVGAFRADIDLVKHDPDLVFIEFAVNDGSGAARNPEEKWRALEGIIRKLKKKNPDTDICFFYTMQEGHLKDLDNGFSYSAVAVHEQVADWYRLPSIYVGPSVKEAVDRGEAVFTGKVVDRNTGLNAEGQLVITEDATHPVVPTGHSFYAAAVGRGIAAMKNVAVPESRELRNPMMAGNYERAKTIPIHGNAVFSGTWEKLTAKNGPGCFRFGKLFYDRFPFLYRTETPGSTVTISFRGTHIGIKGVQGKDGGVIATHLDGELLDEAPQFSVYHNDHFYYGRPLGPFDDGVHTMTWTLTNKEIDKLEILKSYYREGNEKDMLDHPEEYAKRRFSTGEIMLIGEIVPLEPKQIDNDRATEIPTRKAKTESGRNGD